MFCTKCGHKNPDDNKFCVKCGNTLKKPTQKVSPQQISTDFKVYSQNDQPISEIPVVKPSLSQSGADPDLKLQSVENEDMKGDNRSGYNNQEPAINESIQKEEQDKNTDFSSENDNEQTNQNDNDENINFSINEESGKSKTGLIIGVLAALIIIAGGIWGYFAYADAEQKDKAENLLNAWDEYLSQTEAGSIFSTLGEIFLKKDFTEFKYYGFDKYIDGIVEPTGNISKFDIGQYIPGVHIKYNPPIDFEFYMTESLKELYENAIENGYNNSDNWDPIRELNKSLEIVIDEIVVDAYGREGEVLYSITNNADDTQLGIMMNKDSGKWMIRDFYYGDMSLSYILNEYMQNIIELGTISYIGNVYTNDGVFPIKLIVDYSSPVNAIYDNLTQNVMLELSGTFEDGHLELSTESNDEKISFNLTKNNDASLTGKFSSISSAGQLKSYDVILKPEDEDSENQILIEP